ncbi:MAG: alpha/beta hydrolase [Pseudomonadota bacterium]
MTTAHRQFAAIEEGDVHYRCAGLGASGRPLILLHPSPASSRVFLPLLKDLAKDRTAIAPDTLGNGDSCPPASDAPDLADYADSMLRLMDALAIDEFDIYGSHTGSHIGIEMALQAPARVKTLTLHGVALMDRAEQVLFLERYAPAVEPDAIGGQLNWAWHFVRDQMIFYPHFHKDAAHLRVGGDFSAEYLHELTVEVLKNLGHYQKTYQAVFRHDVLARLAKVTQPIALLTHADEPLAAAVEPIRTACPGVQVLNLNDESPRSVGTAIRAFLAAAED